MNGLEGRRRQRGSSLGERLILLAMIALFAALLAVAYGRSPFHALAMIGVALGAGLLVFAFGYISARGLRWWKRRMREYKFAVCGGQFAATAN